MKYEEYVALRDSKKLSDYQVSKDTAISRSTFTQWKKGVITPSLATQARLHKYFKEYDENINKTVEQRLTPLYKQPLNASGAMFGVQVAGYLITLPNGKTISLDNEQYERLQTDISSYIVDWLHGNGIM